MQDRNHRLHGRHGRRTLLAALTILALVGCKGKEPDDRQAGQTQTGAAQVTAAYNALTRDLASVSFDRLTATHVNRRLVILARTLNSDDPPPPPPGMVRSMGQATIYAAELAEIRSESLKIRATYPTSGKLKIIEIPRGDIQAIHVGK